MKRLLWNWKQAIICFILLLTLGRLLMLFINPVLVLFLHIGAFMLMSSDDDYRNRRR